MKIAVLGWYGHNNAGDERIKNCLNHFLMNLGGVDTVDFFDLHEEAIKGKTSKFDHYDLVVIGGGGLIFSQHNYHDFILGLHTRVITAGISVETQLTGNPKKFAKALLEKSSTFLVRDQGSYEKLFILDVERKVKVSADLTFLQPYAPLHAKNEKKIGINLLAKTIHSGLSLKVLLFLNRLRLGCYTKTTCFKKMVADLKGSFDLMPIPLYCAQQESGAPDYRLNDINFMKKYMENVPESFKDTDIDQCELFLSMRLHGLIFAVQKGIPPITFSIYPKQINFMKEVGLDEAIIDVNELGKVNHRVEENLENSIKIKEKIFKYCDSASQVVASDLINALNLIK